MAGYNIVIRRFYNLRNDHSDKPSPCPAPYPVIAILSTIFLVLCLVFLDYFVTANSPFLSVPFFHPSPDPLPANACLLLNPRR